MIVEASPLRLNRKNETNIFKDNAWKHVHKVGQFIPVINLYILVYFQSQKRTGSALKDGEENKRIPESEDESEEEKEEMHEEEHVDGAIEKSEEEISEHAESQEKESKSEDESVKDKGKQRRSSTKSSAKESTEKGKTKKVSLT